MTVAGLAALACYAIHAVFHVSHGRWYDALWACHVAALLVGTGLITKNATLNGIGVLLGLMGLPLWLADLAAGGEFFPTSLLTHVAALALGLFGVAQMGMPRGTWWRATATLLGLIVLARIAAPAEANVNVAFRIQAGYEAYFASHASYLALMMATATAFFFVAERAARYSLSRWCSARLLAHRQ